MQPAPSINDRQMMWIFYAVVCLGIGLSTAYVLIRRTAPVPSPGPPPSEAQPSAPISHQPSVETSLGAGTVAADILLYLQVASVERSRVPEFIQHLRKKGVDTLVAPGITPRVCRIVVGPLSSPEDFASSRAHLSDLGLPEAFPRSYRATPSGCGPEN